MSTVGQPPRWDSAQHAGLGTAFNTSGTAAGYFNGTLDEARVWNHARSVDGIDSTINDARSPRRGPGWSRAGASTRARAATVNGSAGTSGERHDHRQRLDLDRPGPVRLEPAAGRSRPTHRLNLAAAAVSIAQVHLAGPTRPTNEQALRGRALHQRHRRAATRRWPPCRPTRTATTTTTSLPSTPYCYRVRATNLRRRLSDWDVPGLRHHARPRPTTRSPSAAPTPTSPSGTRRRSHLSQFTLECWFRRDGDGVTTSTGTGGITDAIPLLTKGRHEEDGDVRDMNFFLGIRDVGRRARGRLRGGRRPDRPRA